ncbi:hypothetical protein AMTRI_Chr01g131540 [Amborella trichopoda]
MATDTKITGSDASQITKSVGRLEGKVALVTGGANGIGAAIACHFAAHGARVCIADLEDDAGHSVCQSIGPLASYVHCNVTIESDVSNAVNATESTHGPLDILVNNAGIAGPPYRDIRDALTDDFQRVIDVNVRGVFLCTKHAARVMIPRNKGCIISIASTAAVRGGLASHAYAASKHAVVGITKNCAAELGAHGIKVNCISPHAIATRLSMPYLPENEGEGEAVAAFENFVAKNANLKGPTLTVDDIAQAAVYLASDEAKYVSGLNLVVDGGFTSVVNSMGMFS